MTLQSKLRVLGLGGRQREKKPNESPALQTKVVSEQKARSEVKAMYLPVVEKTKGNKPLKYKRVTERRGRKLPSEKHETRKYVSREPGDCNSLVDSLPATRAAPKNDLASNMLKWLALDEEQTEPKVTLGKSDEEPKLLKPIPPPAFILNIKPSHSPIAMKREPSLRTRPVLQSSPSFTGGHSVDSGYSARTKQSSNTMLPKPWPNQLSPQPSVQKIQATVSPPRPSSPRPKTPRQHLQFHRPNQKFSPPVPTKQPPASELKITGKAPPPVSPKLETAPIQEKDARKLCKILQAPSKEVCPGRTSPRSMLCAPSVLSPHTIAKAIAPPPRPEKREKHPVEARRIQGVDERERGYQRVTTSPASTSRASPRSTFSAPVDTKITEKMHPQIEKRKTVTAEVKETNKGGTYLLSTISAPTVFSDLKANTPTLSVSPQLEKRAKDTTDAIRIQEKNEQEEAPETPVQIQEIQAIECVSQTEATEEISTGGTLYRSSSVPIATNCTSTAKEGSTGRSLSRSTSIANSVTKNTATLKEVSAARCSARSSSPAPSVTLNTLLSDLKAKLKVPPLHSRREKALEDTRRKQEKNESESMSHAAAHSKETTSNSVSPRAASPSPDASKGTFISEPQVPPVPSMLDKQQEPVATSAAQDKDEHERLCQSAPAKEASVERNDKPSSFTCFCPQDVGNEEDYRPGQMVEGSTERVLKPEKAQVEASPVQETEGLECASKRGPEYSCWEFFFGIPAAACSSPDGGLVEKIEEGLVKVEVDKTAPPQRASAKEASADGVPNPSGQLAYAIFLCVGPLDECRGEDRNTTVVTAVDSTVSSVDDSTVSTVEGSLAEPAQPEERDEAPAEASRIEEQDGREYAPLQGSAKENPTDVTLFHPPDKRNVKAEAEVSEVTVGKQDNCERLCQTAAPVSSPSGILPIASVDPDDGDDHGEDDDSKSAHLDLSGSTHSSHAISCSTSSEVSSDESCSSDDEFSVDDESTIAIRDEDESAKKYSITLTFDAPLWLR